MGRRSRVVVTTFSTSMSGPASEARACISSWLGRVGQKMRVKWVTPRSRMRTATGRPSAVSAPRAGRRGGAMEVGHGLRTRKVQFQKLEPGRIQNKGCERGDAPVRHIHQRCPLGPGFVGMAPLQIAGKTRWAGGMHHLALMHMAQRPVVISQPQQV